MSDKQEINFLHPENQETRIDLPPETAEFSAAMQKEAEARTSKPVKLSEHGSQVAMQELESKLHEQTKVAEHNEIPNLPLPHSAPEKDKVKLLDRMIDQGSDDGFDQIASLDRVRDD